MKAKLIKNKDSYYLTIDKGTYQEVIAHSFDGGKQRLSLKNCEAIANGYDLDELALEVCDCEANECEIRDEFKKGFQKALEILGDKKFSEEDMKKAFFHVQNEPTFDIFIQLLQQTEIEVEIVMEKCGRCEGCLKAGMWHCAHADTCGNAVELERPKLDADSCVILKRK